MHIFYITLIASIAVIAGCKKEAEPVPERNIPTYNLPDDFLRYFAFKPGSYWVYKNKLNGLYDTVIVSKYTFKYYTLVSGVDGKKLYDYEDFKGEMVSTYYQAKYNYFTLLSPNDIDKNKNGICYGFEMGNYGPWGGEPGGYLMYYPFVSNDSNTAWGGAVRIINNYDTVHYKNNVLDSIITLKIDQCRFFYDSQGIIKIKKGIGVVYKENPNTNFDTWILVDYKTYY